MSITSDQRRKLGAGAAVMLVVLIPLWAEFQEPGQTLWNVALAVILAALVIATIILQLYLLRNIDRVGEARFDTRNNP